MVQRLNDARCTVNKQQSCAAPRARHAHAEAVLQTDSAGTPTGTTASAVPAMVAVVPPPEAGSADLSAAGAAELGGAKTDAVDGETGDAGVNKPLPLPPGAFRGSIFSQKSMYGWLASTVSSPTGCTASSDMSSHVSVPCAAHARQRATRASSVSTPEEDTWKMVILLPFCGACRRSSIPHPPYLSLPLDTQTNMSRTHTHTHAHT